MAKDFYNTHVLINYEWLNAKGEVLCKLVKEADAEDTAKVERAKKEFFVAAMNTAVAAYHLSEWYYKAFKDIDPAKVFHKESFKDFIQHLCDNECKEFKILGDIVDAHKHHTITRQPNKRFHIEASSKRTEPIYWGELPWGQFPWGGYDVKIEGKDGTLCSLLFILGSVKSLWERLLS